MTFSDTPDEVRFHPDPQMTCARMAWLNLMVNLGLLQEHDVVHERVLLLLHAATMNRKSGYGYVAGSRFKAPMVRRRIRTAE